MSDWYDRGREALFEHGVQDTEVSRDEFEAVYAFLSNIGLIDYDNEKEIIWDNYCSEEDEEVEEDEDDG